MQMPWLFAMTTFNIAAVFIQKEVRRWIVHTEKVNKFNESISLMNQTLHHKQKPKDYKCLIPCTYIIASTQIRALWRKRKKCRKKMLCNILHRWVNDYDYDMIAIH